MRSVVFLQAAALGRCWRASATVFLGLCLYFLAATLPASAQDADLAQKRAEFLSLFQQLVKDPTNLELNLRYARLGAEIGDYEASITALERLLVYNPNLPSAQLQLGLLYGRLHSYAMAQVYLQQAAAAPNASPDVRARAEEALAKVDRLASPHQYSGLVELGVQYQNDANAAPGSSSTAPPGFMLPAGIATAKESDGDVFLNGAGIYRYDLGDVERDTVEATGTVFASRFFNNTTVDLALLEATVGPRFTLGRMGLDHATIRPYGVGTYAFLGDNAFFGGYGGGLELTNEFATRTLVKLGFEYQERDYSNASDRPLTTQFNGRVKIARLEAIQPIGEASSLDLLFRYIHEQTQVNFETNNQYRIRASYTIRYAKPFDIGIGPPRPWETSLRVGHDWIPYNGANPAVSTVKRDDKNLYFGASQFLYLTRGFALGLEIDRQINSSNIQNFSYGNTTATFAARLSF